MENSALQSAEADAPQFRAVLRPYRSLSATGFFVLMAFIGGVSLVTGVAFLMMGAWPVLGFFGLDVAFIYYAFRRNYRDAARCEIIEIKDQKLSVVRIDAKGQVQGVAEYNPYWVRLKRVEAPDGSLDLQFVSHGRSMSFASVLNSLQKRSLADALERALVEARGGPRI